MNVGRERSILSDTGKRLSTKSRNLRRSSQDSTIGFDDQQTRELSLFAVHRSRRRGNCPSRSSSSSSRNSVEGTMFSFQVSRGAMRNCFRNRPSVMREVRKGHRAPPSSLSRFHPPVFEACSWASPHPSAGLPSRSTGTLPRSVAQRPGRTRKSGYARDSTASFCIWWSSCRRQYRAPAGKVL